MAKNTGLATANDETETTETTETAKQPSFNLQARNVFLELVGEYETGGVSEATWNKALELAKDAPNVRGVTLSPEIQLANLDLKIANFYDDSSKVQIIDGERYIKQAFQNEILNLERRRNAISKAIEKGTDSE